MMNKQQAFWLVMIATTTIAFFIVVLVLTLKYKKWWAGEDALPHFFRWLNELPGKKRGGEDDEGGNSL